MINLILNIAAATDPSEVSGVFSGYKVEIPPSGIMPASKKGNGKALVNCVVSGATYQQILDITSQQRPVWQIFGAQDLLSGDVHEPLNNSVWNFLPDYPVYDEDGNQIGTEQQTELHVFQGCVGWPSR